MVGGALTSRAECPSAALPIGPIVATVVALLVGLPALRYAVCSSASSARVRVRDFAPAVRRRYLPWLSRTTSAGRRPVVRFRDDGACTTCASLPRPHVLVVSLCAAAARGRDDALRRTKTTPGLRYQRRADEARAFALVRFHMRRRRISVRSSTSAPVRSDGVRPQASIDVFVFAVIGRCRLGLRSLARSTSRRSSDLPDRHPSWLLPERELRSARDLYIAPGGLAAVPTHCATRSSGSRATPEDRGPSLMRLRPSIVERQLIPLGEPPEGAGLAARRGRAGYRLSSASTASGAAGCGRGAPDEHLLSARLRRARGGGVGVRGVPKPEAGARRPRAVDPGTAEEALANDLTRRVPAPPERPSATGTSGSWARCGRYPPHHQEARSGAPAFHAVRLTP